MVLYDLIARSQAFSRFFLLIHPHLTWLTQRDNRNARFAIPPKMLYLMHLPYRLISIRCRESDGGGAGTMFVR